MTALALTGEVSVRERLRAATAEAHRRLDGHALLAAVLSGEGGIIPYRRMLRAYAPLYARIDATIAAAATALPPDIDWRARLKSGWLRHDLAFFGDQPLPDDVAPPLPEVSSNAALVGLLYPVEGSTLGARVIGAKLRQHHAIDEATGGRFLAGYGADTMRRWQAACTWFESIAGDEAEITTAVAAAQAVFACFEATLDAATRA